MGNKYFIHDGTNQQGPFLVEELKLQKISKGSMVWHEGMDTWKPAGEIDELKSIFTVVPPPFVKSTERSNEITDKSLRNEPVMPSQDDKDRKKKLFIMIGTGVLLTLVTLGLILFFALRNSGPEKGLATDSLKIETNAVNGQTDIQNQQQNAQNGQIALKPGETKPVAEDKEEAQRLKYAGSWRTYINAGINFKKVPGPPPMGTQVKEITVTVHNNTPYYLDEVAVTVNFLGSRKEALKSERVTFKGISANSSRSLSAPNGKGYSATTRISKVTSSAMNLNYQ